MTEFYMRNPTIGGARSMTMDTYTACAIAEGFIGREVTEEEQQEAWQYLHDTRIAYQLQGWYGRTAQHLIAEGIINA